VAPGRLAERFRDPAEFSAARGDTRIDAALMRQLPEHAIVMHPLPRVDEITPEVDADSRAAYFRRLRTATERVADYLAARQSG